MLGIAFFYINDKVAEKIDDRLTEPHISQFVTDKLIPLETRVEKLDVLVSEVQANYVKSVLADLHRRIGSLKVSKLCEILSDVFTQEKCIEYLEILIKKGDPFLKDVKVPVTSETKLW